MRHTICLGPDRLPRCFFKSAISCISAYIFTQNLAASKVMTFGKAASRPFHLNQCLWAELGLTRFTSQQSRMFSLEEVASNGTTNLLSY